MITFNDFIQKYKVKNEATSNVKIHEVLKKIGLDSKVGIFLRDDDFPTNYGIVNIHLRRGTHWLCYIKDCYFDLYGCPPPKKLPKYLKHRYKKCFYSEYQIQKNDSFCASYCLYVNYLTKVIGIDFKSAVLNLYCQRFS